MADNNKNVCIFKGGSYLLKLFYYSTKRLDHFTRGYFKNDLDFIEVYLLFQSFLETSKNALNTK